MTEDAGDITYWDDLDEYQMPEEKVQQTLEEADGCVVAWTTRDGSPSSAYVTHALLDGEVYLTMTKGRAKWHAWQRDPRLAATFSVPGAQGRSVTVRGRIELDDDPALSRRFLEALAWRLVPVKGPEGEQFREIFLRHMDHPGRVTGRIVREKTLTFDTVNLPMS